MFFTTELRRISSFWCAEERVCYATASGTQFQKFETVLQSSSSFNRRDFGSRSNPHKTNSNKDYTFPTTVRTNPSS
ncbi:hypothetical protein A4A49_29934 [Nicotiana attenuata]|uniref:Uncharacterized protein n=1 Tax=Nicotiana attenuata TaxID=49451 RepID=A0A314LBA7_NICAT|nr:hypothetical protein A4A49_29934 [Nicotiana attenuata]